MSRGLEALEELMCVLSTNPGTKRYADLFNNSLINPIEKELRALEIIKEKKVDYYQDITESWSYEEYLDNFKYQQSIGDWKEKELLAKEEYELLKEALG